MNKRKADPIIQIFGKDVASIIYRLVHQMLYSKVTLEYHDLQLFPLSDFLESEIYGYAMKARKGGYKYRDLLYFKCKHPYVWNQSGSSSKIELPENY